MRGGVYQRLAGKKIQHPDLPRLPGCVVPGRMRFALAGRLHSGQRKLRGVMQQVRQRCALHVDKRRLSRGMHALQDKLAPIARLQMKIAIVLAGQRGRGCLDAIQFTRDSLRFARRNRFRSFLFQEHP